MEECRRGEGWVSRCDEEGVFWKNTGAEDEESDASKAFYNDTEAVIVP